LEKVEVKGEVKSWYGEKQSKNLARIERFGPER
jgi:hypothetical protein